MSVAQINSCAEKPNTNLFHPGVQAALQNISALVFFCLVEALRSIFLASALIRSFLRSFAATTAREENQF